MEAFIILTILIIVILGTFGRWAKGFFGCCCHECGTKMQPFETKKPTFARRLFCLLISPLKTNFPEEFQGDRPR